MLKRFRMGEFVRYRPLDCYGKVVDKDSHGKRTIYKVRLDKNGSIVYTDATTLEHLPLGKEAR